MVKLRLRLVYSLLLAGVVWACEAPEPVTVSKSFERSYAADQLEWLDLDHQFGNLHIETQPTDRVEVTVRLSATRPTDAQARAVLDLLEIEEDLTEGGVALTTEIVGKLEGTDATNEISIDYYIIAPPTLAVSLSNSFGSVSLGDFDAPVSVEVAYGNFNAGRLNHPESTLEVYNGLGGNVAFFGGEKLVINYTRGLLIGELTETLLEMASSSVEVAQSSFLQVDNQYGTLTLGQAHGLEGVVSYGKVAIDQLNGPLNLQLEYGDGIEIQSINTLTDRIRLELSHSPATLHLPLEAKATFDYRMEYGTWELDHPHAEVTEDRTEEAMRYIRGTLGQGGNALLQFRGSHAKVRLIQ